MTASPHLESLTPAEKAAGKVALSPKFWSFVMGVVGAAASAGVTILSWQESMASKAYVDAQVNVHDHGYAEPAPRDSRGRPAPAHQDLVWVDEAIDIRVKALRKDLDAEKRTSYALARRLAKVAGGNKAVEAFDDASERGLGAEQALQAALAGRR